MALILLVEDEAVNRELFRRRLEKKGHTAIPSENGAQTIALAKSESPDLILMDLGLPDIDGWEVTRRIKADPATARVPIIALSAHATADARAKATAAGCEDFETKPVNWDVVFQKIDAALARAAERAKAPPPPSLDDIDIFGDAPLPADPAATNVVKKGRKHILVVEDNDPNRVMLCRRLQKNGYLTTEAADGRQALAALSKGRFDLVLCDIMMPEVDGYTVLQTMKADAALSTIPIVMVSAIDEVANVARCIEMGADDYLTKPYDPVLLQARVTACLDKRRLSESETDTGHGLELLTRAAEQVEAGTYDDAPIASLALRQDALGVLARAFDRMARAVQRPVAPPPAAPPGDSVTTTQEVRILPGMFKKPGA
jgi:two-component system, cell cycle response regulator